MAELKTTPTELRVEDFLNSLTDEKRRQDCYALLEMMKRVTGAQPKMWGTSIIGFGDFHYTYASGREGDWFQSGFSPRKQNVTIYITGGYLERFEHLLQRLGKYKSGKGCLYIKQLADVDLHVLEELVQASIDNQRNL